MHTPPYDKRPIGTMPNAAYEEGHENVPIGPRLAATAAAQGNVNLLCEPTGERNMPASPKVRDTYRKIGSSEVINQIEAKRACNANRHQ